MKSNIALSNVLANTLRVLPVVAAAAAILTAQAWCASPGAMDPGPTDSRYNARWQSDDTAGAPSDTSGNSAQKRDTASVHNGGDNTTHEDADDGTVKQDSPSHSDYEQMDRGSSRSR